MAIQYEADFAGWAQEQARALSERRFDDLDLTHLTEEVADMGKSERRELKSRLSILVTHLLKWQYQRGHRSRSWWLTIREQRKHLDMLLQDSPSLRNEIEQMLESGYNEALREAVDETGLDYTEFPATCPFSTEQLFAMPVSWNRPQA